MKKLTNKENELMELFWTEGAMFVKDLLEKYDEPKPHFNTLSTMVRTLESNGFLAHKAYGNTYQYYPIVTREQYGKTSINTMVSNFFKGSYLDAVSAFVKEEKISIEELEALIDQVKKGQQ
ncbi:MAG: BlaI/MecI/CopY family transcriptional regulator [Marinilabiliaceae bacterium]|nr:BlaI/MecI/CopY family transcriptional regulator [Marinilabiliaceae bacterium]